jgi:gliding motility-associated-like protein
MLKQVKWAISALAFFAGADIVYSQAEWNREYFGTFHMLNHNHYPTDLELTNVSIPNHNYPLANISDSTGNLLLYSRRGGFYGWPDFSYRIPYLWNRNHQIVNGAEGKLGLHTQLESVLNILNYEDGFSWTGNQVFLPLPKENDNYLVVGISGWNNARHFKLPFKTTYPVPAYEGVLWAGEIDLNADLGKGKMKINKPSVLGNGFSQCALIEGSGNAVSWIVASNWVKDSFFLFRIDSAGIKLNDSWRCPADLRVGLGSSMQISPDGRWIIVTLAKNILNDAGYNYRMLLRVDSETGKFKKSLIIRLNDYNKEVFTLMEFMPNSKEILLGSYNKSGSSIKRFFLDSLIQAEGMLDFDDVLHGSKLARFLSPQFQYVHLGRDANLYFNNIFSAPANNPLIRVKNPCDPEVEWLFDTIKPILPVLHADTMQGYSSLYSNNGSWPIRVATGNIRRLVWSKPLKTPCLGEPLTFAFQNGYQADSVRWNFGDDTIVTARGNDVVHRFTDTGLLEISAIFFGKRVSDTLRRPIRVNYIHRPQLGADTLLCAGGSLVLNAADASVQQYRWSHGPVTASTRIDTAGTYVLEVENEHCIARDTVVVGLLSCDIRQTGFCAGDSSKVSISGLQPDSFKLWANGNPVPVRNKEAALLLDTGLHQLVLEQHVSGMSRRLIPQHRIHPLPAIALGPDTLLCAGQGFALQAPPNLRDYRWSNGSTNNWIEITDSGSYYLRASDGRCFNRDTLKVHAIDCRFSPEGYCLGDTTIVSIGHTADSALVRFGDGNARSATLPAVFAHRYTQEGTYGLQVDWYNKGMKTRSVRNISITAVWEPFLSDSLAVCNNATLEPEQLTTGARYQWSTGSSSRNIRITEAGSYPLSVQKGQCRVCDTVKLSLLDCQCRLFMPNIFTPNMNGVNEGLEPVFDCVPEAYQLLVFNRWGQLVFDNQRSSQGWNGRYRGEPVPDGVFVWQLNFKDPLSGQFRSEKGTVLVLR